MYTNMQGYRSNAAISATRTAINLAVYGAGDTDPLSAASLSAKYAAAWPGSRIAAEMAQQYVERRQVTRTGAGDEWTVGGELRHTASHTANTCTCREVATADPKFGRLCSHRIAIMIQKRLYQDSAAKLYGIFLACAAEPYVSLTITRRYNRSAEDHKTLRSVSTPGAGGMDVFFPGAAVDLDNAGILAAANQAGWTLSKAPVLERSAGGAGGIITYRYVFVRVDAAHAPLGAAELLEHSAGSVHAYRPEQQQNERLAARFAAELQNA